MPDATTIIAIVGGIFGIVGGSGGIISLVQMYREARRERTLDVWESYREQIKSAEARKDTGEVERLRREYEGQHEAWRAQQGLEKVAPRQISAAGAQTLLTVDEVQQLKRLLAQSQPLSPALLSGDEYFLRGNARVEAAQYDEALADYNRALKLRPDDPDTLNNRGAALGRLGRYEEALADHNRSLELRPDHPDVLNNRGNALAGLGRHKEALADYNRALELRPDHAGTYYNHACLSAVQGKVVEAIEDLRLAIERDPKYREDARTDHDFDGIRSDPRFRALVGEGEESSQAGSA